MKNLVWFFVSVVVYSAIALVVVQPETIPGYLLIVGIIVPLCVPFSVNGNIFTILGSGTSEKSFFSMVSLYQSAGGNAFSIVGLGHQRAEKDTVLLWGISACQEARGDALFGIGISGYQRARGDASLGFGISGYQEGRVHARFGFGIAGYQKSGCEAEVALGIAGYQKVRTKTRILGLFSRLEARPGSPI